MAAAAAASVVPGFVSRELAVVLLSDEATSLRAVAAFVVVV